jgi:hypothetical protein
LSPSAGCGFDLFVELAIFSLNPIKIFSIEYEESQFFMMSNLEMMMSPFVLSTQSKLIFDVNFTFGGSDG